MNDDTYSNQNPEQQQPGETPAPEPPREQQQAPPPPGGYYAGQPQYPQYPPYAPPPPRRGKWWIIPTAIGGGCLLWVIVSILFFGAIGAMFSGLGTTGPMERGDHVALIRVSGVITAGQSSSSPFSESVAGSEDIVSRLESIRKNSAAKAVVLRINSPGGSPSGSEEIYNAIKRLRDSGKVVYTSMGDVAASGGYYIAAASDKIYADANTLTGSIGVIFSLADMSELFDKVGYRPETIKAGKYKDIGSPNRALTSEERKLLQDLVNDTYTNFLQSVADGRKIPLNRVRELAEGKIYTGNQALKVKLVDQIGGMHETVRAAARAGGVVGEPKVVEYGKKGIFESFFGGESGQASSRFEEALARALIKRMLSREAAGDLR